MLMSSVNMTGEYMERKKKDTRIRGTYVLPDDIDEAAKRYAKDNDSSLATIVRQQLRRFLVAEGYLPETPKPKSEGVEFQGESPEGGTPLWPTPHKRSACG